MQQPSYVSHLRYLDADDVADGPVNFGGLDVRDSTGDTLGNLDGFIVDSTGSRILYTVVDSGGWFTSRRFLVPIGHTTLSSDRKALVMDLTRDDLRNLPEYDEDRFRAFTDDDLRAFETRTVMACHPDQPVTATNWSYDTRHYREPAWWATGKGRERLRPLEARPYRTAAGVAGATAVRTGETHERELVRAREEEDSGVVRATDDVSPHLGGRAQPGDVLGVETGGERTYLGETGEDEDKRRRTAERSVRRDDER